MQNDKPTLPATAHANSTDLVRAFVRNNLGMALLFFLFALGVRLYFVRTHPNFDNVFSVRGVPYSDGHVWVAPAIKLAQGDGLGDVFRPGLSILLALFYVWFGTSFYLITGLQAVIGAITAALIYLLGERVFNKPIAFAAAIFFAFDLSQLSQTPQATTEPLGLMFFVASVYCLLRIDGWEKLRPAGFAGLFLALSNLTRPLTLFCAPFYAAYLVILGWLGTRSLTKMLLPACAFCLALLLALSPWLTRQRMVHGVWTVSTNLAEALYAATSPKYKIWKYEVRAEADAAGIPNTVGARYKYFVAESLNNLRRDPSFYLRQVSSSYWEFLNCFDPAARADKYVFGYGRWSGLVEAQALFFLLVTGLLAAAALRVWLGAGSFAGIILTLVSAGLLTLWCYMPRYSGFLILLFGIAMSGWRCHRSGVALLAMSLAVAGLGDAIFNNAILFRAVLMTDWIFSFFYFAAFYLSAAFMTEIILRFLRQPQVLCPPAPAGTSTSADEVLGVFAASMRNILKIVSAILVVFFLAGSVRLLALNLRKTRGHEPGDLQLSSDDKRQIIDRLRSAAPFLRDALPQSANFSFLDRKQIREATERMAKKSSKTQQGARSVPRLGKTELVIGSEKLSPFVYYFPRGTEFERRDRLFKRRPFDYSILRSSYGTLIFPGRIPRSLRERQVVLVGWVEGRHPNGARFGSITQCIAIIPVLEKGSGLDYKHAVTVKPQLNGIL